MSEPSTYIKLDRNILTWGWYTDANTMRLFVHLLLKANVKDKEWMGQTIHRGELATSYSNLAEELGLSVRNVRTALEHLKLTKEVTSRNLTKFTIISISKYDTYQLCDKVSDKQPTSDRQASDKQPTTTKEYKNIRIKEKNIYGEFQNVKLTDEELEKLKSRFSDWNDKIENLSAYIKSKGDRYKDHYATILTWERNDSKKNGANGQFNKQIESSGNLQYGLVF